MERTYAAGLNRAQGALIALTTTNQFFGIPPGVREVRLWADASTAQVQFSPRIQKFIRTQDNKVTFTDLTANVTDRVTGTIATISGQDTAANGDYLYVGCRDPITGLWVDATGFNVNASVMTVKYWNGSAWGTTTATDGTINPAGTTLGADGLVYWSSPTDEARTSVGATGSQAELFWYEITFSAALSGTVTIAELYTRCIDTAAALRIPLNAQPLAYGVNDARIGNMEGTASAGTANLHVHYVYY